MNLFNKLFGIEESPTSSMTPTERELVSQLKQMGFEENPALVAVRSSQGNLEHAITILTQNQNQSTSAQPYASPPSSQTPAQRAAAAAFERQRAVPGATKRSRANVQSVQNNDVERVAARIRGLATRVAMFPGTLDALHVIVSAICKAPKDKKFKRISSTNRVYKERIKGCAPADQLLLALGFSKQRVSSSSFEYVLKSTDVALFWLGKSALEEQKKSDVYKQAKEMVAFETALQQSLNSATSEEEARRASYLSQVPKEPVIGASLSTLSRINVNLAGKSFQRLFYSDETVLVLLQWMGSLSSIVPDKLIAGEWQLVDMSLYPPKAVAVGGSLECTLHSMDWFPSAELIVKPGSSSEGET